ncbi:MAG: hypothetical protein E6K18_06445 [Methanobacteriota archaeon]|nr:MAG: hypothetical protein E6K18_06445 [Euryarchaeota archaeon]
MAFDTAINPTTLLILGILLIVVGLVLAFFGRKVWTPFMSFVGAIIGGTVGYIIGGFYAPSGYVVALVLGLIGSILGSILFNYLVKIALALITAAIPATLTYYAMGGNAVSDQTARDTPVIVAILVLVLVFAIAYYFVEELIGVVTALVGGALLGVGIFLATGSGTYALGGGAGVFLAGSILQTMAIRAAKKGSVWRLRRARAARAAPAPYVPPPSSPPMAAPPAPPPSSPPAGMPPPPPPP